MKLAVYDSLRKGLPKYNRFLKGQAQYLTTKKLSEVEYCLWDVDGVAAVGTAFGLQSNLVLDVFDVPPKLAHWISLMEIGQGKKPQTIVINGDEVLFWVWKDVPDSAKLINSGDWLAYISEKSTAQNNNDL